MHHSETFRPNRPSLADYVKQIMAASADISHYLCMRGYFGGVAVGNSGDARAGGVVDA